MNKQNLNSPDVYRVVAVIGCAVTVFICLAYAYLRNDLPAWWRDHGGGIPYVMFWSMFWFMFFPFRGYVFAICLFATMVTCAIEFAQLWKPDWLTQFRSTKFGAALLGSGFTWYDFPPYLIGGATSYLILRIATFEFRKSA